MLPGQGYLTGTHRASARRSRPGGRSASRSLEEELDERDDLAAPLAQRRHVELNDLQPVIQVRAELPAADHVCRSRFVAAITRTSTGIGRLLPSLVNGVILRTCSSLACSDARHLADLVEHHRASFGELELADRGRLRTGERAALVSEQLALQELERQRRAIDLHERRFRRGDCRCSSLAMTSLPTPLSPVRSTRTSLSATRSTIVSTGLIDEEFDQHG